MSLKYHSLVTLLGAVLVACGGGGGGGAGYTITGVAASGAAIAQGPVEVKCRVGTGSAVTALDGSYSVTILGGQGPCLLRATDPVTRTEFHSALEEDATVRIAHITPLSELVVARTLGMDPATAFGDPTGQPFSKLTADKLNEGISAAQAVVQAVGGESLTENPLKGTLRTATAEVQGSAIDRALDAIMATLAAADKAISDLAARLKDRSNSAADSVSNAGVSTTSLLNCPSARSGRVWVIDSFSNQAPKAYNLNFSNNTMTELGGSSSSITVSTSASCVFAAGGKEFRIASSGIGIWQQSAGTQVTGFGVLVPMQPSVSLTAQSFTGKYGALAYLKASANGMDFTQAAPYGFTINSPGGPLIQGLQCQINSSGTDRLPVCTGIENQYALALVDQNCTSVQLTQAGVAFDSGALRCTNSGGVDAYAIGYKSGGSSTLFLAINNFPIPIQGVSAATGLMVLSKVESALPLPQVASIAQGAFWEVSYDPTAPVNGKAPFAGGEVPASTISPIPGSNRSYRQTRGTSTYTHHLDAPTGGLIWSRTGASDYMVRLASPAGWSFAAEKVAALQGIGDIYKVSAQVRMP